MCHVEILIVPYLREPFLPDECWRWGRFWWPVGSEGLKWWSLSVFLNRLFNLGREMAMRQVCCKGGFPHMEGWRLVLCACQATFSCLFQTKFDNLARKRFEPVHFILLHIVQKFTAHWFFKCYDPHENQFCVRHSGNVLLRECVIWKKNKLEQQGTALSLEALSDQI